MNTNWFDRLARDVARGMSRREAVRLLAGSTAMAVFGSWVRPSRAMSARSGVAPDPGCSGTRTFYRPDCKKPVPKLNYKASFNGCGPEGGVFGTGINAVPNNPLYLANFTPACNTHDIGYSTCNRPKADTDYQFLVDNNVICNNQYPGSGMFDTILLADCKYAATTFYIAVKDGGEDAYKAGQAGACDCCEECQIGRNAGSTATCPNTCPGPNKPCCVAIKYGYHVGGCCRPGEECCVGSNNTQDHPNQMSWCCPTGTCGPAGGKCNRSPCVAK